MAQVGRDRDALEAGDAFLQFEAGLVQSEVDRYRRAIASLEEGVRLHDIVGQHGDLEARHVDGGITRTGHLVERAGGRDGQARRRDVDAEHHRATAQALYRQGVVDFGGGRIVDAEGLHRGKGQFLANGRRLERRQSMTLGEVLEEKAPPVELVGAADGAGLLQQIERRLVRVLARFHHGLVLEAVLVGLEEDAIELLADRLGAAALDQLLRPRLDLGLLLLLALDAQERRLDDVFRCLLEAPASHATEVMRRLEQAEQRRGLLHHAGLGVEIVTRHIGETEFVGGSKFPGQVQIDFAGQALPLREQLRRGRLVELEQDAWRT